MPNSTKIPSLPLGQVLELLDCGEGLTITLMLALTPKETLVPFETVKAILMAHEKDLYVSDEMYGNVTWFEIYANRLCEAYEEIDENFDRRIIEEELAMYPFNRITDKRFECWNGQWLLDENYRAIAAGNHYCFACGTLHKDEDLVEYPKWHGEHCPNCNPSDHGEDLVSDLATWILDEFFGTGIGRLAIEKLGLDVEGEDDGKIIETMRSFMDKVGFQIVHTDEKRDVDAEFMGIVARGTAVRIACGP